MKNTENFTNRILKRVDQSSPLTWEQLDNNNLYANVWKLGVTYKKTMIVLWNDSTTMGGDNSINGHSSFWIYISTNENTISSNSNRPGSTGGASFWHRLESFLSSGAISGNNINLTMNDGTIVAIPLNDPTFTGAVLANTIQLSSVYCSSFKTEQAQNNIMTVTSLNGDPTLSKLILDADETHGNTIADKTDNTTKLATTAFVQAQKDSPTFTGAINMSGASSVTAPTVVSTDNDTTVATTAFVQAQKDSPTFIGNVNISHVNNNVSAGQVFATPGTKIVNGSSANFTDFSIGDTIIISYSPTFTTTIVEITSDNLITVYADIPTNAGYPYNYYITRNSIKYKSDFNANNGAINMSGASSVTAPTVVSTDNDTTVATTAFVQSVISSKQTRHTSISTYDIISITGAGIANAGNVGKYQFSSGILQVCEGNGEYNWADAPEPASEYILYKYNGNYYQYVFNINTNEGSLVEKIEATTAFVQAQKDSPTFTGTVTLPAGAEGVALGNYFSTSLFGLAAYIHPTIGVLSYPDNATATAAIGTGMLYINSTTFQLLVTEFI